MEAIYNAAPMHISLGFDVVKQPAVAPQSPAEPFHYPHVWGFAERGQLIPQTITNNFDALFGANTLRPQGKFLTHQSMLAKIFAKNGNQFKFQRLVAPDAARGTIVTWCGRSKEKVTTTASRDMSREGHGTGFAKGDEISQTLVVWFSEPLEIADGSSYEEAVNNLQSAKKSVVGTVGGSSVEFECVPIFMEGQTHGLWGNRTGFSIETLDEKTLMPLDVDQATRIGGRMHTIRFHERPAGSDTPVVQPTRHGLLEATFSLVNDAFDPKLNHDYSLTSVLEDSYTQLNPALPRYPTYAPYDRFAFYSANYFSVISALKAEEDKIFNDGFDEWFVSPFSGRDVKGDDYYSFRVVTPLETQIEDHTVLRWGHSNVNYLTGGKDGDTSNEMFDQLVFEKVSNFGKEYSQRSRERYPISFVYDTGFSLETKLAMAPLTRTRRDLAVGFSIHIHDKGILTPTEELSLARAIMAGARMVPESTYYGTPFARGFLVAGSGEYVPENLPWRVSAILHYADKLSAYAGSGEGKLEPGANFSEYPGNRVTILKNISNPDREDELRVEEWEFGVNVLIPYDEHSFHSPGMFTMFGDDTSPVKSVINMLIAIIGEKRSRRTWHDFAGSDSHRKNVFRDRINKRVREYMDPRKFDDRLNNLEVETIYTRDDLSRGYSWSTRLKMPMNMPMNVGTFHLQIDRLEEGINPESFS